MASKIILLFSIILLIQVISAQYLGYGNLQNGLSGNYASNLAQNIPSNIYGANNFANAYSNNLAGNNIVTSNTLGTNIGLSQNLASNIRSNNLSGQNIANVGTNNLLGQNLNSISNVGNIASNGLFEGITASNGGVFSVTSTSPIVPTGVSVYSDNLLIEGPLSVSGQLPFLSAVAIEGTVPTSGQGAASCGCGDGNIGIVNELNNAGLYGGMGRPGFRY